MLKDVNWQFILSKEANYNGITILQNLSRLTLSLISSFGERVNLKLLRKCCVKCDGIICENDKNRKKNSCVRHDALL